MAIDSARIAFAGTPEFAVPTLDALLAAGRVSVVLTQPDRKAGRGRTLQASPVKQRAMESGIPVLQPERLGDAERPLLPPERPDLLVVVAYGLLLPAWMLDWPKVAPINVHASLLPRWRGASPMQQAILAGDRETGISIMRMTEGLDSGPVYRQLATGIGAKETAGELHDRLARLGAEALMDALPQILAGTEPRPQPGVGITYAPKISKADALIDWTRPASAIERKIRAYHPWPVAETRTTSGSRLRLFVADAVPGEVEAAPGTVVATSGGLIDVATGEGLLRIRRLQPPGGREMSAESYLAAHDLDGAFFAGV